MYKADKFYINGEWVSPSTNDECEVINPATEEVIGTVAMGNENDVNNAVAAAKKAFETFSKTSIEERMALLDRIIAAYKAKMEKIAACVSQEMGAPISMSNAAQAPAGLGHLLFAKTAVEKFKFSEEVGTSHVVREPIGVCGLITPWNWPVNQITAKVGPAIAAGCTMVLKPSEIAPFNAIVFTEIMHEAGTPPGVFNLVNGYGPTVGVAMSSHPDVDMMSFTGSTRAGTAVTCDAADTVKRVTLELGGKSPNLVFADLILRNGLMPLSKSACSILANPAMRLLDCWLNAPAMMMSLKLQSDQRKKQTSATRPMKVIISVLYLIRFNTSEFKG